MTKYLKVAIEFDDSVRNDTLVKDVYGCFAECGASFAGGHFKSEGF